MITTFFHAASTMLEVVSFFVGGCFMCPEQGTGEEGGLGGLGIYRHLTQGRLSRQGLRSVASGFRVRVSGFGLEGSGFRFGSKLQGLGFLFRGLVHEEPRSRSSWDAPRHIGGSISQHRVPPMHHNYVHWNGLDRWQGQRGCEMWQGHDFGNDKHLILWPCHTLKTET